MCYTLNLTAVLPPVKGCTTQVSDFRNYTRIQFYFKNNHYYFFFHIEIKREAIKSVFQSNSIFRVILSQTKKLLVV